MCDIEQKSDLKHQVLKQYFGYSSFRNGQENIIDAILDGKDALAIMPTGAGKSLCFQVPALILEGIVLVISPLISLMQDQVAALKQIGISAAYINSSLSARQYSKAIQLARDGQYKLIYIAPERLNSEDFIDFAQNASISLIAIDEAHCVSQWGQDFRRSYLDISHFIDNLPIRPPIGAFTATATEHVQQDIISYLNLQNPTIVTTGFDRANLYYEVRRNTTKLAETKSILKENPDQCTIIYCSTRKNVEQVFESLEKEHYSVTRYHAGLSDEERTQNQDDFIYDKKMIMVATNAFGMGIDKSNVSLVIHYNMPKNLENYYQEAGRAGRDGAPAKCILLYNGQDVKINQFMIEKNAEENPDLDDANKKSRVEAEKVKLREMTFYCTMPVCLRGYILRYFGEKPSNFCGNCSNCGGEGIEKDITIDAQKIMSCIKRTKERYGTGLIVNLLLGKKTDNRIELYHLDEIKTFGAMAEEKPATIHSEIDYLIYCGYLVVEKDNGYPILKLGKPAQKVLFQDEKIFMKMPAVEGKLSKKKSAKSEKEKKSVRERRRLPDINPDLLPNPTDPQYFSPNATWQIQTLTPDDLPELQRRSEEEDERIFNILRDLRAQIAKEENIPAYLVFSNATLKDMVAVWPQNKAEMLTVSGVGEKKMEKYGQLFLEKLAELI